MPQATSSLLKSTAVWLINLYRNLLRNIVLPACRFTPTCSEYARVAVERYGVATGLRMTLWRLARCHPFAKPGWDPIE